MKRNHSNKIITNYLVLATLFLNSCSSLFYSDTMRSKNNTVLVKTNVENYTVSNQKNTKFRAELDSRENKIEFKKLNYKSTFLTFTSENCTPINVKVKRTPRMGAVLMDLPFCFFYGLTYGIDVFRGDFYKVSSKSKTIELNFRYTNEFFLKQADECVARLDTNLLNSIQNQYPDYGLTKLITDKKNEIIEAKFKIACEKIYKTQDTTYLNELLAKNTDPTKVEKLETIKSTIKTEIYNSELKRIYNQSDLKAIDKLISIERNSSKAQELTELKNKIIQENKTLDSLRTIYYANRINEKTFYFPLIKKNLYPLNDIISNAVNKDAVIKNKITSIADTVTKTNSRGQKFEVIEMSTDNLFYHKKEWKTESKTVQKKYYPPSSEKETMYRMGVISMSDLRNSNFYIIKDVEENKWAHQIQNNYGIPVFKNENIFKEIKPLYERYLIFKGENDLYGVIELSEESLKNNSFLILENKFSKIEFTEYYKSLTVTKPNGEIAIISIDGVVEKKWKPEPEKPLKQRVLEINNGYFFNNLYSGTYVGGDYSNAKITFQVDKTNNEFKICSIGVAANGKAYLNESCITLDKFHFDNERIYFEFSGSITQSNDVYSIDRKIKNGKIENSIEHNGSYGIEKTIQLQFETSLTGDIISFRVCFLDASGKPDCGGANYYGGSVSRKK